MVLGTTSKSLKYSVTKVTDKITVWYSSKKTIKLVEHTIPVRVTTNRVGLALLPIDWLIDSLSNFFLFLYYSLFTQSQKPTINIQHHNNQIKMTLRLRDVILNKLWIKGFNFHQIVSIKELVLLYTHIPQLQGETSPVQFEMKLQHQKI